MSRARGAETRRAIEQSAGTGRRAPRTYSTRSRTLEEETRQIPLRDAALLDDFFSSLGAAFERSIFGAILDRQHESSVSSRRCWECEGTGIIDGEGGFSIERPTFPEQPKRDPDRGAPIFEAVGPEEDPEKYRVESKPEDVGKWCSKCNGTGSIDTDHTGKLHVRCRACTLVSRVRREDPYGRFGPHEKAWRYWSRQRGRRAACSVCCGTGSPLLTADITAGRQPSVGFLPDDRKLELFAQCARRLMLVSAVAPILTATLKAFYGNVGARWGATKHGRIFGVFELTRSGSRLAAIAQKSVAKEAKKLTKKEAAARLRWRNPPPLTHHKFGRRQRRAAGGVRFALLEDKPDFLARRLPDRKRNPVAELRATYDSDMPAHERIGWAAGLVGIPDEWSKLLAAARVEALDLYARAVDAWNSTAPREIGGDENADR